MNHHFYCLLFFTDYYHYNQCLLFSALFYNHHYKLSLSVEISLLSLLLLVILNADKTSVKLQFISYFLELFRFIVLSLLLLYATANCKDGESLFSFIIIWNSMRVLRHSKCFCKQSVFANPIWTTFRSTACRIYIQIHRYCTLLNLCVVREVRNGVCKNTIL